MSLRLGGLVLVPVVLLASASPVAAQAEGVSVETRIRGRLLSSDSAVTCSPGVTSGADRVALDEAEGRRGERFRGGTLSVETSEFRAELPALEMLDAQIGRLRLRLTNLSADTVFAGLRHQAEVGGWFRNRDLKTGDVHVYELPPDAPVRVAARVYVAGYSPDASLGLRFGPGEPANGTSSPGRLSQVEAGLECHLRRLPWARQATANFASEEYGRVQMFLREGPDLEARITERVRERDRALEAVATLLGIEPPTGVRVVVYPDPFLKWIDTGHAGMGWAFDSTLVEVRGTARDMDPFHELTHLVGRRVGSPPAFLREGLATYVAERLGGEALRFLGRSGSVREAACSDLETDRLVPLDQALEMPEIGPEGTRPAVTYPQSASFVGFLVRRRGMESFLTAYAGLTGSDGPEEGGRDPVAFREVFGTSLSQAETAWLEELSEACGSAGPAGPPSGGSS